MSNIIVMHRRPADGLLKELRRDLEACYAIAEEHLTAAQDAVNESNTTDHTSLRFIDACGTIIHNHKVPFHVRACALTELFAGWAGIEFERKELCHSAE